MRLKFISWLRNLNRAISRLEAQADSQLLRWETEMLLLGRIAAQQARSKRAINSPADVEFKVFSQFGDDGIIQWLVGNLEFPNKTFIEFGVENYRESNTRFLMMNDNWSGLVMDGTDANIRQIINAEYFWKYELNARYAFIDRDNVNALLSETGFDRNVGILHIDLDGNDYWIWKQIDVISPLTVIMEYNSVFGIERSITIPYDPHFVRTKAHPSNLYWGASLRALYELAMHKGYSFIGCNTAGNNAYFVRKDALNDAVKEVSLENGYVLSKYRESRDTEGRLTSVAGSARLNVIRGLPVYNVHTDEMDVI